MLIWKLTMHKQLCMPLKKWTLSLFPGCRTLLNERRPSYYEWNESTIISLTSSNMVPSHISSRLNGLGCQRQVFHIVSFLDSWWHTPSCFHLDYKTWQWISTLVSKCRKNLHNTLEKYNILARSMIPPKTLAHMGTGHKSGVFNTYWNSARTRWHLYKGLDKAVLPRCSKSMGEAAKGSWRTCHHWYWSLSNYHINTGWGRSI